MDVGELCQHSVIKRSKTGEVAVVNPGAVQGSQLPPDVVANVLTRLDFLSRLYSSSVCKTWRLAYDDPAIWSVIIVDDTRTRPDHQSNLAYRLTDQHLRALLAKAQGNLRILSLKCCWRLTRRSLEAVLAACKNVAMEVLALSSCSSLRGADVGDLILNILARDVQIVPLKVEGCWKLNVSEVDCREMSEKLEKVPLHICEDCAMVTSETLQCSSCSSKDICRGCVNYCMDPAGCRGHGLRDMYCDDCRHACSQCQLILCGDCYIQCDVCGHDFCSRCCTVQDDLPLATCHDCAKNPGFNGSGNASNPQQQLESRCFSCPMQAGTFFKCSYPGCTVNKLCSGCVQKCMDPEQSPEGLPVKVRCRQTSDSEVLTTLCMRHVAYCHACQVTLCSTCQVSCRFCDRTCCSWCAVRCVSCENVQCNRCPQECPSCYAPQCNACYAPAALPTTCVGH